MIQDTLGKIEERIRASESITPQQREELLGLLAALKGEVNSLPEADRERAQSIAGFTAVSAHEATRDEKNPELVKLSIRGLSQSVEGFEESHPKLVQLVNSISTMLSNLGI
jgi:predicted component of type VI protein secretion system